MNCSTEGCDRRAIARGMCKTHYGQDWRMRNADEIAERYMYPCRICRAKCWSLDRCIRCRGVGLPKLNRTTWRCQQLNETVYLKRTYGPMTLRIYSGDSVKWEVENVKTGKVWSGGTTDIAEAKKRAMKRAWVSMKQLEAK